LQAAREQAFSLRNFPEIILFKLAHFSLVASPLEAGIPPYC